MLRYALAQGLQLDDTTRPVPLKLLSPHPARLGSFSGVFPGMPVVLMAQDSRGTPTYYGRRDIVRFLGDISMSRIPWKWYTVS
jgi:hypothetical protein